MTKKIFVTISWVYIALALSLFACTSNGTTAPSTVTNLPVSPTLTSLPSSPIPTESIPRWMEYETALADAILSETGFCEWEILGQLGQEVYVWALCQIRLLEPGTAGSVPAVIYLTPDGKIKNVAIPGNGVDYGPDIEKLFPPDIQPLVVSLPMGGNQYIQQAMEHIAQRRADPSIPPMIVEAGTLLP